MKLLALAAITATTFGAYEQPSKYNNDYGYKADQSGYKAEPSYNNHQSGYGYKAEPAYNHGYDEKSGYKADTGYGYQAEASYGTPAPYGAPAYSPEADPKAEWDQYWSNIALCKAEFSLNECFLECNNVKQFLNERRLQNCVTSFVRGLCGAISEKRIQKCDNGRVSITTDNCQTSAYADALLKLDQMGQNFQIKVRGRFKHEIWNFASVELALKVNNQLADCATEALLYYLSQCAKHHFFDHADAQCVEDHLENAECGFAVEDGERFDIQHLLDLLALKDDVKAYKYIKKYYGAYKHDEDEVLDALEELAEEFLVPSKDPFIIQAEYSKHKLRAGLDVCPVDYLTMNHGYDQYKIPGLPENCVAFHFRRDGPKYKPFEKESEEESKVSSRASKAPARPSKGGYALLEDAEPKPESKASAEKEEYDLDPLTPKKGIYHKCEEHYYFSKALYILTGHDIGNICYTIDGYSIKFLESGNEEELDYEWIHQELATQTLLEDSAYVEAKPKPSGKPSEPKSEPKPELADVVPPGLATCYRASWRAQKTCVSHLSEWRMKVRCCKSYAQAKKFYTKPVAKPTYKNEQYYNNGNHYNQNDQYYKQQPQPKGNYYHQEPQQSNYYKEQPKYLLEEEYAQPTKAYYGDHNYGYQQQDGYKQQQPQGYGYQQEQYPQQKQEYGYQQQANHYPEEQKYPKQEEKYAPAHYEKYSSKVYEFTKVIKSNKDHGTIVKYEEGNPVPMDNQDLIDEYKKWAEALLEARKTAQNITNNTDEYYKVLHKYKYGKHHVSYAQKFDLPNATYEHRKGFYLGGNHYARETCESLKIDIDFDAVIPLVTGKCLPQSCILSQYAACVDNPRAHYKSYKPAYKPSPYHQPYNNYYAPSAVYYRNLLSSSNDSILSFASIGFVAGVVVVALIQFVVSKRSTTTMNAL